MNLIFLNFTRPFTPEGGKLPSPTGGGAGGEVP